MKTIKDIFAEVMGFLLNYKNTASIQTIRYNFKESSKPNILQINNMPMFYIWIATLLKSLVVQNFQVKHQRPRLVLGWMTEKNKKILKRADYCVP